MSPEIELIERYNAEISRVAALPASEPAEPVIESLREFITDDYRLYEAITVPWGGEFFGPAGLKDFIRMILGVFVEYKIKPIGMTPPEYFQRDSTVIRQVTNTFARVEDPDQQFVLRLLERYEFTNGKISECDEFYQDSALLLKFLNPDT